MQSYNQKDTISAISTPIGEGAISIVRLSGKDAISIADTIFSKDIQNLKSKTAALGNILDTDKKAVDSAVLIVYRAPNSFTGEDIVEIQCHGGRLITQKVFEITLLAGARASLAGEFTMRAFLNKKIDLTQAEAIQDLISAKNSLAMKAAKNQLEGHLSKKIKEFQKKIVEIVAFIEANLDFPEEDLQDASKNTLVENLSQISKDIQKLVDTFEDGKVLKEGLSLCIVGAVNVGKSSLMNAILKKDRAIVTNISGTTRDVLKEDLKLNEMLYQLIDTAGIRKASNVIEKEGIKRSKKELKDADITLLVLDSSRKLNEEDRQIFEKLDSKKTIAIWNKIDLLEPKVIEPTVVEPTVVEPKSLDSKVETKEKIDFENVVKISAKKREGLTALYSMIEKLTFKSKISTNEIIITQKRHKIALIDSLKYLDKAINDLKNDISHEFIAVDLKSSLLELSKIIGFDITEDILTSIFSNFCIGK
ncbi:MAG: tRNA modification GTPase MnmE [Candidatus Anoxychlamydiales bacterium]|nr:tRNA modification GTPase MnmE [Candidatus Anoxychlamydiales bacterium]